MANENIRDHPCVQAKLCKRHRGAHEVDNPAPYELPRS